MIKVIRIDHRLLHGQVIFAWTKSQGIERIVVIDNVAAGDDFKKMSLKLSKPADIKLSVFSVDQAKERIAKINNLKKYHDYFLEMFCKLDRLSHFWKGLKKLTMEVLKIGQTRSDSVMQFF